MPGMHTGPEACGGNPVLAVQGRRGRQTRQRRRAATSGRPRRGRWELCPSAVRHRNSADGIRVSLRGTCPGRRRGSDGHRSCLLRLGGLLRAVALGADGAPQEESHALTAPRPRCRQPKQLNAGIFQAEINSFVLRLAAENKAAKTIRTYTEAVQWFAATGLPRRTRQAGPGVRPRASWPGWSGGARAAASPSAATPRPASGCPSWPACAAVTSTCGSGSSSSAARAARTGSSASATKPPSAWTGTCAPAPGTPTPGGPSCGGSSGYVFIASQIVPSERLLAGRCAPDLAHGVSSGHTRILCCAASRISCASMPTRVSPVSSWHMNSRGPRGGSGHAHHRESRQCDVPPPPRDRRIGAAGSASSGGLPLGTMRPSESRRLSWKDCRSASVPLGAPGTGSSSKPGASGRMRRVTKISNPLL